MSARTSLRAYAAIHRCIPLRPVVSLALILLGFVVIGCGIGGEEAPEFKTLDQLVTERLPKAMRELCRARDAARQGNVERSRDLFIGDTHQFTHDLSAVVNQTDMAAANRLLIAVSNVEAELFVSAMPSAARLASLLDALTVEIGAAAARIGLQAPPCT